MRKIVPVITVALLLCVGIGITVKAKTTEDITIADGIYIGPVNVGGMTEEEAFEAVTSYIENASDATFTLTVGDREVSVTAEDIALNFEESNAVEKAIRVGRSGSLIQRYKDKKDLEQENLILPIGASIDTELLTQVIEENAEKLNDEVIDNGLTRENDKFVFVEGTAGIEVNVKESVAEIEKFLMESWDGEDASISLVAEVTEPKGTKEELSRVQDLLGTFTTNYNTSSAARCTNIAVAAGKINGTVLYPGDEFSVGQTINPLDKANGYELAGAYENGQTVQAYGGGVCQVSTTLYNAILLAELEVSQRSNHSMIVTYVPPSQDAAIAGDYKDLKFINNQDAPIYIEAVIVGKNVTFNIYGEETRAANREVSYVSEVVSVDDPATQFVATGDPAGIVKTAQSKHTGYVARLLKVVKEDGVEVSREQCNKSTYKASPKVVHVGTASADPNVTAAIQAAIATGDEATINAAVGPYAAALAAEQAAAQAAAEQAAAAQAASQAAQAASQETQAATPPVQ